MKVNLIAKTQFAIPNHVPWDTDSDGGQALAEFAGRACYQSWSKPNPETATNAGYLAHIINVGHHSVLEHATATFYIEGVSRSLTHELVRHRHLSFSQLSQRYVDESNAEFVMPPALREHANLEFFSSHEAGDDYDDGWVGAGEYFRTHMSETAELYAKYVKAFVSAGLNRKQAREAARAVLPNATETKIVATGNIRAWRHFVEIRGAEGADAEIRELAIEILTQLRREFPNFFPDLDVIFHIDANKKLVWRD